MKLIDLSHSLKNGMPVFPGDEPPVFSPRGDVETGDVSRITDIRMNTHIGTHIDCNSHVTAGGFCTDTQELSFFVGRGVAVDCTGCAEHITLETLQRYELNDKSFVLLFCDWARHWGTPEFFGRFPVLTNEAALYLAELENLRGIGVESMSIDPIEDGTLPLHKIFLARPDKCVIENLCNMEALLGRGFTFMALPLKIEGGEASPVRAVAILD